MRRVPVSRWLAAVAGLAVLTTVTAAGPRPVSLIINGTTVQTPSFEGAGAWTTWATKILTVALNAGSNTIRFTPTASDGLPDVDHLEVA